ncbi:hypothetical protein SNE40_018942 [Patella caerulea]|uniref:Uncharacterized protein n=1 Tax=Patella caerulea TaxID=87958 RepID=A0AAN8J5S8_PATCE
MLVFKLSCVLAAVLSVYSVNTPCCTDREWSADMGLTGSSFRSGFFTPLEGHSTMFYDYHGKKLTIKTSLGSTYKNTVLLDYDKKREYFLVNGKCSVYELVIALRKPCIPANATYLRESIYGFGSNTLVADVWEYVEPSNGALTRFSVTRDSCIPLIQAQYNPHPPAQPGTQTDIVYVYSNFNPGIKDRSVFDIPTACVNQTVQV